MRKKKKKVLPNFRCMALANGPIGTRVKGSKNGKRGYDRKDKSWKQDCSE